jgi:hypothetical protein
VVMASRFHASCWLGRATTGAASVMNVRAARANGEGPRGAPRRTGLLRTNARGAAHGALARRGRMDDVNAARNISAC